ncbi:hypothetical protein [Streptomyces corynorhini]|uniref:Uncharacterized protein n=1 Tax=Streptomyces corynorhini TaxID=2282652 RepID=A0A370B7K4_9ACTN|nr:hypothetical protein [Streptomyces corynorhini]RDG36632.1 hypothetical protein DVH02_18635 [Streptomyces corynorhini]
MSDRSENASYETLSSMLRRLIGESGLSQRQAMQACAGDGPSYSTFRGWLEGRTAPDAKAERTARFWVLVRTLRASAGNPVYSDAEWEAALLAAQRDAARRSHRASWSKEQPVPKTNFVRPHVAGLDPSTLDLSGLRIRDVLVGREEERRALAAFVRADEPSAPSYLCWHTRLRSGKTALLADCVRKPPPDADVLNYFVSEARGTHTRTAFTTEMGQQIGSFLGLGEPAVPSPRDPREWAALLRRAARKSAGRGRRLLLLVDGLDEDVAWSTRGAEGSGSIAALLPARPHGNLRIVVSVRRGPRLPSDLPDDLPAGHPLRPRECLRLLGPSERAAEAGPTPRAAADRLRASELGRTVMDLLAVAGGGLRGADLAELAGVPVGLVDRLLQSADGRCVVRDDPATDLATGTGTATGTETYALGSEDVLRSIVEELGPTGMARHAGRLHAWADRWRSAGWPEGTPPYLLTGYLRLLDSPARREEYVLDGLRQVRLAAVTGHDVPLAQVAALRSALGDLGADAEHLGLAARLAASRVFLLRPARQVPPEAPALFVRLGDAERARSLARSAPEPVVKAAHLARVAVELSRKGLEGTTSVGREAAEWAARAAHVLARPAHDVDAYASLAQSAHALHALEETETARALLRAVVLSGTADVETLVAAVNVLTEDDGESNGQSDCESESKSESNGEKWVAAVMAQARDLSAGGPRAQAAAVDIWATIARRKPSCGAHARGHIARLCEELDPSGGLAVVDVLALAASALRSRKTVAPRLARTALDRLSDALTDPENLSPADRAHLRRELSTTLERLTRAVDHTGIGLRALDEIEELVTALPDGMRTGLLDDNLTERGEANISTAARRRAVEDSVLRKQDVELKRLQQRHVDPQKKQQQKHVDPPKAKLGSRRRPPRGGTPSPNHSEDDHGARQPEHTALLEAADRLLRNGNVLLGRERLEAALRCSPPATAPAGAAHSGWALSLVQALGFVGEFTYADRLTSALPEESRVRHLAAVSMGCSQGGYDIAAGRYAREATLLVTDMADPALRGVVSQALAHAGDAIGAVELAEREEPRGAMSSARIKIQNRRSVTAVAAGLARLRPEAAARLIEPVTTQLSRRTMDNGLREPLPQLVSLLLALPDVRRPGPQLGEALRYAARQFAHAPVQRWDAATAVLLALLDRLNCCPELELPLVADAIGQWPGTLPPDQVPHAELALLKAVEGETAAAQRLAEAAPTPDGRAAALVAVATYLAAVPVALPVDRAPADATLRLCLALAYAAGDGTAPDEAAARLLVRPALEGTGWAHAIPLLPRLAPGALVPLGELTLAHGHPDSTGAPDVTAGSGAR